MSRERRIGVVLAACRADGRWLLVRRAAGLERAPLKVGLPGGEVHPGETPVQALHREVREELGVTVELLAPFIEHDLPDRPWRLHGWLGVIGSQSLRPDPREIAEILWLTPQEAIDHPDGLATNSLFIREALRVASEGNA